MMSVIGLINKSRHAFRNMVGVGRDHRIYLGTTLLVFSIQQLWFVTRTNSHNDLIDA